MNKSDDLQEESNGELAERIAYLINGYLQDDLTETEHDELDDWVVSSLKNQQLFEELTDPGNIQKWMEWKKGLDSRAALLRLKRELGLKEEISSETKNKNRPYWIAAAVFIGIIILIAVSRQGSAPAKENLVAVKTDLSPGGKHATLIKGNGTQILVDTLTSSTLSLGKQISISSNVGLLDYAATHNKIADAEMNTLSIPAGGEFQVRLSDGTKVWLNASSTLRYPVQFSDSVRKVELSGEAYFEIEKDVSHPFIVTAGANTVTVLGTNFNINSYPDQTAAVVTVLQGSVKLNRSVILKPGQKGEISSSGEIKTGAADGEAVTGWKNGLFVFKETPLDEVMEQVAHWYDARIIYKDNITAHFNARIPRNVAASKLLHLLEETGQIHFKIEDKTITVMN